MNGTAAATHVAWFQTVFQVVFQETGLKAGATWWVNLSGNLNASSSTNSLSVNEPNGTFSYDVGTTDKTYASAGTPKRLGRTTANPATFSDGAISSCSMNQRFRSVEPSLSPTPASSKYQIVITGARTCRNSRRGYSPSTHWTAASTSIFAEMCASYELWFIEHQYEAVDWVDQDDDKREELNELVLEGGRYEEPVIYEHRKDIERMFKRGRRCRPGWLPTGAHGGGYRLRGISAVTWDGVMEEIAERRCNSGI